MKNLRVLQMDMAVEIGINEALVVGQLHYWSSKPNIGMVVDGVKYIKNSYEQWIAEENFPCFSLSTIKRIFKKLINMGIVLVNKFKKGSWDHTNYFALNYSHPSVRLDQSIVSNCPDRKCQSDPIDSVNLTRSLNTYNTPERTTEKTYREPPVSFSSKPGVKPRAKEMAREVLERTPHPTSTEEFRKQYYEAKQWYKAQSEDFKEQAREYMEYHCNQPKVNYPMAVKKTILVEIWKKQNDMENDTDFHYIDKQKLLNVCAVEIERRPFKRHTYEEEMQRLYENGQLFEQTVG